MEGFSINSESLERNKVIEAHAKFDAIEYVNLMRKKSPESLEIDDNFGVVLNIEDGDEIMENTKSKLGLSPKELKFYLETFEDKVKEILKNEQSSQGDEDKI